MRFDQEVLFDRLGRLEPRFAAAFAASVAERLLPAMISASDSGAVDAARVIETLDLVWRWSAGTPVDAHEAARRCDACQQIAKQLSQAEQVAAKYGEDGVLALAYALRAYTIAPREAGWAGQCGYEAVDYFVTEECGVDYSTQGEEAVLNHPVVHRELERQQEDLEYLERLAKEGKSASTSIGQLRERARLQSESTFALDA